MQTIANRLCKLAAGALLSLGAASAMAAPSFQVNPNALGLTPTAGVGATFTADFMNGTSSTRITQDGVNPLKYSADGYIQFTAFTNTGGGGAISGVTTGVGLDYGLYATFHQEFLCPGLLGPGVTCGATAITLSLYADPWLAFGAQDNVFTSATLGAGTNVADTSGNDINLANVNVIVNGLAGIDALGGAFENLNSNFVLTAQGKQYFFDPDPFYALAFSAFNNTSQGVACNTAGCVGATVVAVNSEVGGTDFNRIPEPGSLALLGLGMLAPPFARRRKQ